VRWRSGRSRAPPTSSGRQRPRRASSAWGAKIRTCAAASSMASGSPSSRAQIAATSAAFPAVRAKEGRTACAHCTKRATAGKRATAAGSAPSAGVGRASGGTGKVCSPRTRSAARLVTSATTPGHAPSSAASAGPAPATCSMLSSSSSRSLSRKWAWSRSSTGCPAASRRPSARAMVGSAKAGSRRAARLTVTTPSAKALSRPATTCWARRVLPTPPGPVSVSRRTSGWRSRCATAASSRSRPSNGVSGAGSASMNSPGALSAVSPTAPRPVSLTGSTAAGWRRQAARTAARSASSACRASSRVSTVWR